MTYPLIFSKSLSEKLIILRRNELDIFTNVLTPSCKAPVILVRLYSKLHFLDRFSKSNQIPNLMKIRPVEAELFHAGGEIDRRMNGQR